LLVLLQNVLSSLSLTLKASSLPRHGRYTTDQVRLVLMRFENRVFRGAIIDISIRKLFEAVPVLLDWSLIHFVLINTVAFWSLGMSDFIIIYSIQGHHSSLVVLLRAVLKDLRICRLRWFLIRVLV